MRRDREFEPGDMIEHSDRALVGRAGRPASSSVVIRLFPLRVLEVDLRRGEQVVPPHRGKETRKKKKMKMKGHVQTFRPGDLITHLRRGLVGRAGRPVGSTRSSGCSRAVSWRWALFEDGQWLLLVRKKEEEGTERETRSG
jgi:hypothetical protein